MMENPYLSLIIPTYNDEGVIEKSLKRISEYLESQNYSWEILVVLDGPKDSTPEKVASYQEKFGDKMRIIKNGRNYGKGYTVRNGMLKARGDIRVFSDADNSTDIKYLEAMLVKLREGYDVVISTRDSKDAKGAGQEIPQSFLKRSVGNMGNIFIQIMAVPGIWDTQNGFKGFTAEAAKKLFSRSLMNRWSFDVEILAIARKFNYKIGIIPVLWNNNSLSNVKILSYIHMLWETTKIRLNLWTGKYK